MTNRKTYKEMFTEILSVVTSAEHKEFIEKQIALLEKKSATRKGADYSAHQAVVLEMLGNSLGGMTLSEMANANDVFRTEDGMVFSTSRMNAIVKDLLADGKVVKSKEKGKMVFRLATEG